MQRNSFLLGLTAFALLLNIGRCHAEGPEDGLITIKLQRTVCYGTCPAYSLELNQSGELIYIGEKFVKISGRQTARIDPSVVAELARKLDSGNFFSLPKNNDGDCMPYATDNPTATISLEYKGRKHTFEDDLGCLGTKWDWIRKIEQEIDSAAGVEKFIR